MLFVLQEALPAGSEELNLRPFYAALPYDDQMKALEPSKVKRNGLAVRKCVIATNIAETSVTIPGVVYVVDSGFVKVRCAGLGFRSDPYKPHLRRTCFAYRCPCLIRSLAWNRWSPNLCQKRKRTSVLDVLAGCAPASAFACTPKLRLIAFVQSTLFVCVSACAVFIGLACCACAVLCS